MHRNTAFERRERLNIDQLDQLLVALRDEVERYRVAIRGYDPAKMARHGEPYLDKLEGRVRDIETLVDRKRSVSLPSPQS